MVFYNFALAFVLCAAAFVIGEAVSTRTKAWVPSVFVTAVVMLGFFWVAGPRYTNLVTDAQLLPWGAGLGIYLLITHMGTVISLRQLAQQWKTIAICLLGLVGMCLFCWLIAIPLIGRDYVIAGLPPLTGGIVAATVMQQAALDAGLESAALFAITMYCVQGFAGYPLTAVCLQKEGRSLLKQFRSGTPAEKAPDQEVAKDGHLAQSTHVRRIPTLPAKWNTTVMMLGKLALVAWLATLLGQVRFPGIGPISGAIWALILGVLCTSLGFLDQDLLHKANSYGLVMFALMMYVFDGLKTCTPEMLGAIIVPMVVVILVGVAGMALFVFLGSKLLKLHFPMALATALTALYGFPPNAIITESTCKALADGNSAAETYLINKMLPAMLVGGFTTVTITSVFVAGFFANLL